MVNTKEKVQIHRIVELLEAAYPKSTSTLKARSPLELLVATILSAQSTDTQVNRVTTRLFQKYRTVADFANSDLRQLQEDIYQVGYYRQKAKFLQGTCRMLIEDYNGLVPNTMEELLKLPGVGRKTANIVLNRAFGVVEGIAVDTHVLRISRRLGLSDASTPTKVEKDLMVTFPRDKWGQVNRLFITHGRSICQARHPKCESCLLNKICQYASTQS